MKKLGIQARVENIFWGERNNFGDETSLAGTNCSAESPPVHAPMSGRSESPGVNLHKTGKIDETNTSD
jgi:hypothetical protein